MKTFEEFVNNIDKTFFESMNPREQDPEYLAILQMLGGDVEAANAKYDDLMQRQYKLKKSRMTSTKTPDEQGPMGDPRHGPGWKSSTTGGRGMMGMP